MFAGGPRCPQIIIAAERDKGSVEAAQAHIRTMLFEKENIKGIGHDGKR